MWSFVHVADAAEATVAGVARGSRGVYNVVDDEPVAVAEWLPELAKQLSDTRVAGIGGRYEQSATRERNLQIADVTNAIAKDRNVKSSQVAIAWILAQRHRAPIVPILGVRTSAQLHDNLAALELDLTQDELERLDLASHVELGFPHDFDVGQLVYGNIETLIDDHRHAEGAI